jgi:hypothetical protein
MPNGQGSYVGWGLLCDSEIERRSSEKQVLCEIATTDHIVFKRRNLGEWSRKPVSRNEKVEE